MSTPPSFSLASPLRFTATREKIEKLNEARDKLLKNKRAVYLASDLAENLVWESDSEGQGFVVLSDQIKQKSEHEIAINDDDDANTLASDDEQEPPEDTTLAVIARVSKQHCYLSPDGNWKGERQNTKTLAELKLWLSLEAVSEYEDLRRDFEGCKRAIQRLRELRQTHFDWHCDGVLVKGEKDSENIKLRHCVFLPKLDAGDDKEETAIIPSGSVPFDLAEYTLRGYPLSHQVARDERERMVTEKTHILNVIGAYDVNGKRIPPSRVASHLRGAIVKAYFTLSHTPISGQDKDRFMADLVSLRVIIPPPTPRRQSTKDKGHEDPLTDSDDDAEQEDSKDPFDRKDKPPMKKRRKLLDFDFFPVKQVQTRKK